MEATGAIIKTAAEGAAGTPAFGGGSILIVVLFIAVFYFIAIRPQSKQMNEKRTMLGNLRPEDAVVTIGGIHGVVVRSDEDEETIILRVAPGVEIEFLKAAVQSITNRDWRDEFPQYKKKSLFAPRGDK
jgi:preprotein translocase subunit YajC